MSDHTLDQLDPKVLGKNSTIRTSKSEKLRGFFGISKSKSKDKGINSMTSNQTTKPTSTISQANNSPPGDSQSAVSSLVIQESKIQSSLQPSPPNKAQVVIDVFSDNVPKPAIKTALPRLQERIESTEKLVYCMSLLLQDSLSPASVPRDDASLLQEHNKRLD
ncbi:hypothetical protein EC991_002950 [Linnemannia zychae]|nr:hypothetical protein EC991_002950 [Linnemannia zychae]